MRFAFKTSPQNTTWPTCSPCGRWPTTSSCSSRAGPSTTSIRSSPTARALHGGWTTLTAMAQATTRLRMGTLVTGIHYRHPAILANMATTLDIVSEGRLELGIGAGWNEEESGRRDRARDAGRAQRPLRRGLRGDRRSPHAGDDDLQRPVLPAHRCPQRTQAGPAPPPTDLHRGSGERRTLAPQPGSPSIGTSWAARPRSSPASATSCISTAGTSARPAEILLSSHVRFAGDAKAAAEQAARWPRSGRPRHRLPPAASEPGRARAVGQRPARALTSPKQRRRRGCHGRWAVQSRVSYGTVMAPSWKLPRRIDSTSVMRLVAWGSPRSMTYE